MGRRPKAPSSCKTLTTENLSIKTNLDSFQTKYLIWKKAWLGLKTVERTLTEPGKLKKNEIEVEYDTSNLDVIWILKLPEYCLIKQGSSQDTITGKPKVLVCRSQVGSSI